MIEYIFRPIDKWPREFTKKRRVSSPFKVDHTKALRHLAREAAQLGARRLVIQLAIEPSAVRVDGLPYADTKPKHPGVIVAFEGKHGPIKMPCDAFVDWRDNIRAIGLTLERLRLADAYGVTQHGEQYRGWTALPPGPGGTPRMTAHEAAAFINQHVPFVATDWIIERKDAFEIAYRQAAKALHPDSGGDAELFKQLQDAAEVLRAHHGVTE